MQRPSGRLYQWEESRRGQENTLISTHYMWKKSFTARFKALFDGRPLPSINGVLSLAKFAIWALLDAVFVCCRMCTSQYRSHKRVGHMLGVGSQLEHCWNVLIFIPRPVTYSILSQIIHSFFSDCNFCLFLVTSSTPQSQKSLICIWWCLWDFMSP